jgi:hypothetical protein
MSERTAVTINFPVKGAHENAKKTPTTFLSMVGRHR